jgi:hypothetical protein
MHNIKTPDLPASVLKTRNQYLREQEQSKTSRVPKFKEELQG